jgi:two-component system chemotaxis sensor kinase CheA
MPKDPYQYFRIEAREIVEQLSRGVLDLEQGISGTEITGRLLRLAHTLKGAAHVVKQTAIAHLAHELEDALVPYAHGQPLPREKAAGMLQRIDGITAQLATLEGDQGTPAETAAPAVGEEFFDTVRVDLGDMDALLEGIAETGIQVAGLKAKLAAMEQAADLSSVLLNQLSARGASNGNGRSAAALAKTRGLAQDLEAALRPLHRNLVAGVEQVERELAQVRDTSSRLRLVPASAVFAPLRRAVRNTASRWSLKPAAASTVWTRTFWRRYVRPCCT